MAYNFQDALVVIQNTKGRPACIRLYCFSTLHREEKTWKVIHFMDKAGREINITGLWQSGTAPDCAMHASLNKIYSSIQQIARHQRAIELDADAVAKMRPLCA